jgi:hypothetical protein
VLFGRQRERGVLDWLVVGARDADGGAIVVLGEPGIGKTALIEQAVTSAQDFRILRTAGRELCARARVRISGRGEPSRLSDDGIPRSMVTSPPTGGSVFV